ncbi:hypothetical protein [Tenacibaculum finnmarkense]|uniref:hypothetical protein n=1 Tax=Tenacibaculum TaxID=104267 RepID=UPI000C7B6914|nr:hypothetical protein [Tenacibaculum finnmarkense]SOU86359.1 conserved hypothetical protein [Tenacibaculum dicentrarchi]MCD8423618.1 PD-(D/E)XK nuclease family protein [Tenacibaculum finnmarkense genomovar ulcerans]MCG8239779.1 hypothetical protein [Tenacibaculum finnmarkense genomovar ulcerans]MCG8796603.1 hypothetical protein [Tenacibaculum finnmarkense]MCG8798927.1 hypothetical protein [Tenacibaculum finnmarkense]
MLENKLRNKTSASEDELTSTIIGTMKYLPSNLFWSLIRKSCFENSNLPENSGEIETFIFWPKWNAENTTNSKYVEPDIFFSFENFNLIIEVKPFDSFGQTSGQWENQIQSYFNEYETEKKVIYISLGGNYDKTNDEISICDKKITIHKCDWISILIEVSSTLKELKKIKTPLNNIHQIIRILQDIINGFNYFNYYNIKWFEEINNYNVENKRISISYE